MTMTPEQVEAILQSNAKAIASNSDTIAAVRKETSDTIAETRREITALFQFASELARDRAVMFDILRGLNEDRIRTAENLSSIAENIARIAAAMEQRNE
jgi:acyl-CoA reductase-like NAD-dependent aldehyde dehydrogenase